MKGLIMSLQTISWNVPFGTAKSACKNSKGNKKDMCCNLKTGEAKGSYDNFKGLATVPIAAVSAASGAEAISAGTVCATGALGALGAAMTAGLVSCVSNLRTNAKDMPKTIRKNIPNVLHTF